MTIILIATIVLFATYIIFLFKVERYPQSISDSFYIFNEYKKGLGNLFTVWCFLMTFLIMVQMLNASEGKWFQFLGLFAAGGLGFVGTAPYFKGHEKTIHTISAIVCAVSGSLWILLMGHCLAVLIPFFLVFRIRPNNLLFFGEVTLFISLFITLFLA